MLVAAPGQTTAYSTLHNSGNTTTTGPSAKKSSLTSTTTNATSGTPKTLINNNHNTITTSSTSNTNNSYNHHQHQHQNNKNGNNNTTTTSSTTSSKDPKSSTAHSLKTENSTKPMNFIQTLKDSVQKALICTTGHNSISKQIADKLQNCNKSTTTTTSLQNVTSSSSNNAKVAAATATSSISNNSANAASTSSSSLSLVRSKYSACSLAKLHTIAPTITHRFPEDRQHASSTDSLQKEMCHFKPIRTVPTTPWKSGSKSRGNSLRFPKPNIATKKNEFILKSNCDVNNRKKKQQQLIQDDIDDEDDDNEDEQENKEYHGIYKPKPSSTYLPTTVTTPNHQSAFVCMVSQMKNLGNMQTKKITAPGKSAGGTTVAGSLELAKTKNTRATRPAKDGTTILNVTTTSTISNTPNKKAKSATNEPVKELFVRQKQKTTNKSLTQVKKLDIAKDLVIPLTTRSTRLALAAEKRKLLTNTTITHDIENDAVVKRKSSKAGDISKISQAGITKAKSRRKLGSSKSKTINMEQMASAEATEKILPTATSRGNAYTKINKRKRKINHPEDIEPLPEQSAAPPPTQGRARKSVRRSKDIGASSDKLLKNQLTTTSSNSKHLHKQKSALCFSPPLTRARLKHLNQELQGKIAAISTSVVEIKKRKI